MSHCTMLAGIMFSIAGKKTLKMSNPLKMAVLWWDVWYLSLFMPYIFSFSCTHHRDIKTCKVSGGDSLTCCRLSLWFHAVWHSVDKHFFWVSVILHIHHTCALTKSILRRVKQKQIMQLNTIEEKRNKCKIGRNWVIDRFWKMTRLIKGWHTHIQKSRKSPLRALVPFSL